jgi:hypothetical protein
MCIKCFQTVSPLEIHWHVPQYDSGDSCRHSLRCNTISSFQRKGIIKYFIVSVNSKGGMCYTWPRTVLGSLWKKILVDLRLNSGPQACLASALLFVALCQNFLCYFSFGIGVGIQALLIDPLHQTFYSVMGYFETGSHELFPWTDFEMWSSCSVPWLCMFTALSHWCQDCVRYFWDRVFLFAWAGFKLSSFWYLPPE